jgi:intracellular sulfur oxidation DsrE/DsrF family protein
MSKRVIWWTAITASASAAFLISFLFAASRARASDARVGVEHRGVVHGNDAAEVAHGAGIGLVERKNVALRDRVATIEKTGPVFAACTNTMKKKHLTADDLTAGVEIVDSGVAELIRRQEAGWTYIKLGD